MRARYCGTLMLWAGAMTSCGILVDGQLDRIPCHMRTEAMSDSLCPSDMHCVEGWCVACAKVEQCGNGLDDDCDGLVDEVCSGGTDAPCTKGSCPQGRVCVESELAGGVGSKCLPGCCSSPECLETEVCLGEVGELIGSCVPLTTLSERLRGLGTRPVGDDCYDHEDCRSGRCGDERICVDTCCDDLDCPAPMTCVAGTSGLFCGLPLTL